LLPEAGLVIAPEVTPIPGVPVLPVAVPAAGEEAPTPPLVAVIPAPGVRVPLPKEALSMVQLLVGVGVLVLLPTPALPAVAVPALVAPEPVLPVLEEELLEAGQLKAIVWPVSPPIFRF